MNKTLSVVLLAAATLGFWSCSTPGNRESSAAPRRAISVQIVQVDLAAIPDVFEVPGTVRAKTSTTLSSRIIGQIVSISVGEGDSVRAGQTVAEIDNREASSQLRRVEAAQTEAQEALAEVERGIAAANAALSAAAAIRDLSASTLKRYESLIERRSVSPQEFDEIQARYKAAAAETERAGESLAAVKAKRLQAIAGVERVAAELESAKIALGYARLVSPIDGIVASKPAEPGMLAAPGMPLINIEGKDYELEALVDESRIGSIKQNDPVEVQLDAVAGLFQARVRTIVPAGDPATRTYQVKLELAANTGARSGSFGRAVFSAGSRQALLVPQRAIVRRGQLTSLYVADSGIARLRLVKPGKEHGGGIEILSGLDAGTRIVLNPPSELEDGSRIQSDEE